MCSQFSPPFLIDFRACILSLHNLSWFIRFIFSKIIKKSSFSIKGVKIFYQNETLWSCFLTFLLRKTAGYLPKNYYICTENNIFLIPRYQLSKPIFQIITLITIFVFDNIDQAINVANLFFHLFFPSFLKKTSSKKYAHY